MRDKVAHICTKSLAKGCSGERVYDLFITLAVPTCMQAQSACMHIWFFVVVVRELFKSCQL